MVSNLTRSKAGENSAPDVVYHETNSFVAQCQSVSSCMVLFLSRSLSRSDLLNHCVGQLCRCILFTVLQASLRWASQKLFVITAPMVGFAQFNSILSFTATSRICFTGSTVFAWSLEFDALELSIHECSEPSSTASSSGVIDFSFFFSEH